MSRFEEIACKVVSFLGYEIYLDGKNLLLNTLTAKDFARWLLLHEYCHNSGPLPLFSQNVNKFSKKSYGFVELRVDLTTIKIIIENISLGVLSSEFYNVIAIIMAERIFRASIYNFNQHWTSDKGMFSKEVEGDTAIAFLVLLTKFNIFDPANKTLNTGHVGPWRGQPGRDAPRPEARGPAGARHGHRRPRRRLPAGGAGTRHHRRDDAVPRPRRPLDARRAPTSVATLFSTATAGTAEPRRHAAHGRRRPGRGLHYDLARSVVPRARATRLGGPRPRRARPDPLGRPLLRRRSPATPADLGRHRQGRDPAGRRAAAPAGDLITR